MGVPVYKFQEYTDILQTKLDDGYLFIQKNHIPGGFDYLYCLFSIGYQSGYYFWRQHPNGNIVLKMKINNDDTKIDIPGYITKFGLMLCESISNGTSLLEYSNSIVEII